MRPLSNSLTREELSRLLDVPLELVDALLESGKVLCQIRGGQPRIPLAQLEVFFRDALMSIYQHEAAPEQVAAQPVPSAVPRSAPELLAERLPDESPTNVE